MKSVAGAPFARKFPLSVSDSLEAHMPASPLRLRAPAPLGDLPLWPCLATVLALTIGAFAGRSAAQELSSAALTGPYADSTTAAIRRLPPEQAMQSLPVRVRGRVAFISHPGTVFIQDGEAGTFFRTRESLAHVEVGDELEIEGGTIAGLYLTGIEAVRFRSLSKGPPPTPREVSFDDLLSGRFHYQRVKVRGVVRQMTPIDEDRTRLVVAMGQRSLDIRLEAAPAQGDWVDTLVEINGLAAGAINDRRQLVQPQLLVSSWLEVRIDSPAPAPDELPVVPAGSLFRFNAQSDSRPHLRRVRVTGQTLASFGDGRCFLRDTSQETPVAFAIRLQPGQPLPAAGEILDLVGFPEMAGFSARLHDATLLKRTPGPPPAPRSLDQLPFPSSDTDSDLITIQATLIQQGQTADTTEWQLSANGQSVRALLPGRFGQILAPGSRLSLTAICEVEGSVERGFRAQPASARLWLRSSSDITVIDAPPWWTTTRLVGALAILALATILALVWVTQLRRRLTWQTQALRSRIAHEATLEERQRLAREFHDTLEQDLAGLSIRLGALGSRPLETKAADLLDTSLHLVSRIQTEARNLVADLRAPDDQISDLSLALRQLTASATNPGGPEVRVDIPEPLPVLEGSVVHHLRMIAQEAITNALKHAHASQIQLRLRAQDSRLRLEITDDGTGFDPSLDSPPGHFGRRGMTERARRVGASILWRSSLGQGTSVIVDCPVSRPISPGS